MNVDITQVKNSLYERFETPELRSLVDKSVIYLNKCISTKKKDGNIWVDKYKFDAGWLITAVSECIDSGFGLDGINYVISGNRLYLPTYHAYKNKIYMVYPESVIDIELVREGDKYQFAKESGSVVYSHEIADSFNESESDIKGAYCVIRNNRGEFLERLNKTDYNKMKAVSKNPDVWDMWPSEFWLKSVIKRACKRHFRDITLKIDEHDNEAVGLKDMVEASDSHVNKIVEAKRANNESRG